MTGNKIERWDGLKEIWQIIERLRSETGCPWDRKQTPGTIQTYLVEESHEAAAAIRAGETQDAAEELGDVLFMVLFLVYLYEEKGNFGLEDVCSLICEKMVRRHPHVFGETCVRSAEEVKDNWEIIKAGEKNASGKAPEPVPESLPALMRAYRVLSRLSHTQDGRWGDIRVQAGSLAEKSGRLAEAVAEGRSLTKDSIAEVFLELVNLARLQGFRSEDLLHDLVRKIEDGKKER